MELCMSGGEEGLKVNGLKEVHLMLKEEVEKAQSLLNSSHDKAIKVHVYICSWIELKHDSIPYILIVNPRLLESQGEAKK